MKNTVLIVDDDLVMVALLKKLFDKKYTVFTACDGVEAMFYLSHGIMPDVILSDLMMENINGYEFVKHLQTSVLYKEIPVIIISSMPANDIIKTFPTVKVFNKPFDPITLQHIVGSTMLKIKTKLTTCNN